MSVRVILTSPKGERVEAQAEPGDDLLRVAQAAGLPLEGTCEGQMACSTCHVIVARDWIDRLPEPSEEEEDMLDLAVGVTATSRLACQIVLDDALNGLEAQIPAESTDARRF